ncbi:hypothetical protein QL093DRAFT_2107535 [Fusarium oxysporum]|nr:hypothetical protein QL093DRAFT_2107535 [Fusarium oxysporum]
MSLWAVMTGSCTSFLRPPASGPSGRDGTGDFTLHQHVAAFGKDIDSMEKGDVGPRMAFNANGSLLPKQLSQDMIITFCVAARILLYGLEPGFDPRQPTG